MTATNTSKPAKDGTGAAFNLEMAAESFSGNNTQKTYLASPSTEGLIEPMQQTGGSVTITASPGAGNIATAQVSVTTGNIQVVATRAGRFAVTIINTGTTAVYLGITGLSTATGILLAGVVGASVTIPTTAAIFGTVAAGTQTVCVLETF